MLTTRSSYVLLRVLLRKHVVRTQVYVVRTTWYVVHVYVPVHVHVVRCPVLRRSGAYAYGSEFDRGARARVGGAGRLGHVQCVHHHQEVLLVHSANLATSIVHEQCQHEAEERDEDKGEAKDRHERRARRRSVAATQRLL